MEVDDFLFDALAKNAGVAPESIFIADGKRALSYAEALDEISHRSSPISESKNSNVNSVDGVIEMLRARFDGAKSSLLNLKEQLSQADFASVKNIIDTEPGIFAKTSGSTGVPKLVYITYNSQLVTALSINSDVLDNVNYDELLVLPLHHSSGLGRFRAAMLRGAAVYLCQVPLKPKEFKLQLSRSTNQAMALTPASWRYLKGMFRDDVWGTLAPVKAIEFGSAPLLSEEIAELSENLPDTVLKMHYGLTEASRSFLRDLHKSKDGLSIGTPMSHVQANLAGDSELLVAGPHLARFIIDGPNLTIYGDENNWIPTGDLVKSVDGNYAITGRKKDQINVGGVKVSPLEVESKLADLGLNGSFAVCGVSHSMLGEAVGLCLESGGLRNYKAIEGSLRDLLPAVCLPHKVVEVDELPLLPNLKLDRVKIKEILANDISE